MHLNVEFERGNYIMKYTSIAAKRSMGEYIALVPAFYNGYEYARAYSYELDELKELLDDLVL
jgi:hypothetical protein